jgi:hypothetical protein
MIDKIKKVISRDHSFENRLTFVERSGNRYKFFHEKSNYPCMLTETAELQEAFEVENWDALEEIEKAWESH